MTSTTNDLSRRRFLQMAAAGVAVASMPSWIAKEAQAATPLRAGEGVLVLLTMAGGNDGLSTFVPTGDGNYYDLRRDLAIPAAATLPMAGSRRLNQNLPFLQKLWDRGNMAVIDGVGHTDATLSHFTSMAQIMTGHTRNLLDGSGWLGRFMDGYAHQQGTVDPFLGVSVSSSVPLVANGRQRRAIAISEDRNNIFLDGGSDPTYERQYRALKAMGTTSTSLGALADRAAAAGANAVDLSTQLRPILSDPPDEAQVITRMRLAAKLINANVGVRVVSVMFGDFDTHANQLTMHRDRMVELNASIEAFFETLNPTFADRALVVGTSEFGRRARSNGSGTDHGAANSLFALGTQVKGGFYGEQPSLRTLDRHGNIIPTVDYRSLYGTVLTTWLQADSSEVIGREYENLGFVNPPATNAVSTPFVPQAETAVGRRARLARLYLAYFGRTPTEHSFEHWYGAMRSGTGLEQISAALAGSEEFTARYGAVSDGQFTDLAYRNVLNRSPDEQGRQHWLGVLGGGGSRGAMMAEMAESAEFVSSSAAAVWRMELIAALGRLYWAYFLRRADRPGLEFWINTEAPFDTVSESFAASAEFGRRYGTLSNAEFVNLVYRNVLGRDPDSSGHAYWTDLLDRGRTRGAVMGGFSNSAEFTRRVQRLI